MLSAAGCGGANAAAERQMEQFRKEIARVQGDNERLNERVTALEVGQAKTLTEAREARQEAGVPKLQVVKLEPGQDPDALDASDEADADPSEEPTVIRGEGNRFSTVAPPARDKAKPGSRSAQAARDYDAALALVKRKQYDKALEALAGLLVRYPDDPTAENAMYWRGECFYAKGDYTRAAEEFNGLVTRFPTGNKAPDALLKLGMAQLKTGAKEKAADSFARLRRDFPSSELVRKIPKD
jgi:tol-pal system protein YbgF